MNNYKLVKNTEWKEVEINGENKEIPKDWRVTSIEKSIEMEKNTKSSQILNSLILNKGTIPVIGQEVEFISGYANNITPLVANKENPTIIFGDHSCTLKFINFNYVLGGDGTKVFKGNKEIKTNFLFYSIKNLNFKTDGYKRHFSILKEKLINIPPIQTQSSIASILSEQESITQDIESLISKYESRFQYLSDKLLSGRLRVKEVDGEFVLYKNPEDNWKEVEINGEIKEIPKDWEVEKIYKNIKFSIGNTPKKINDNYKGSLAWVTISNLNEKYVSKHTAKIKKLNNVKIIPKGSLFGSFKMSVGKFGFATQDCATNEAIISIKPTDTIYNLNYLYYRLPSVFLENAETNGQGTLLLNTTKIKDLDYIVPSIKEQNSIAIILNEQEELISEQKYFFEKEKQKFNWLLDNLLSGKYLVEQI